MTRFNQAWRRRNFGAVSYGQARAVTSLREQVSELVHVPTESENINARSYKRSRERRGRRGMTGDFGA